VAWTPVEVLDISQSPVIMTDIYVSEGAESNSVTLIWQSRPGRTYAVFASEDLQTWTQLNSDSVPSGGDQTSFTDEAISQKETSRYYRVEESAFAGPQVISSGEVFDLKINPELDPSLDPPTPPYNPPAVVHDGSALMKGAMASIRRNVDGVTVNIMIDDLNPNHAYTTWFVEMGVGGPPPFLAGAITGDSGEAWFSGHMSAVSPMYGEFHIIIADHGPLNLLPPTYDFTSSVPPIGLDSDGAWKLNWPMVIIFEPIGSGEMFHLKINPELDPSRVPPTPPYNPPAVVHDGSALLKGKGAMASIRRNVDGVSIKIEIDDLNPNHAYTTWFVELGVGGPPPFLAGAITGDSGDALFSGDISAVSPMNGEFHVIIADHGPLDLLPPTYDFTSSMPPIGLDSDNVWKLNWPMVVIFEPISSGEVFNLKINPELDPSLDPPTPPYNPPAVVHDGGALINGAKASIDRNVDGVTVNIKIDDLNPNHAYTTWFVEIGVGGPPPFLAGEITGESGEGWFSGHMSVVSPMDGEFHIIIADHGPLDLLPPGYDFTSSVPPIGLDSDGVWKLNWPMVVIFEYFRAVKNVCGDGVSQCIGSLRSSGLFFYF
jgi:predicted RNA-binding protein with TRAM domain